MGAISPALKFGAGPTLMADDGELEFDAVPEPEFGDASVREAPSAVSFDYVEYAAPDGEKWRVERGSHLIAEFGLDGPDMLPIWHGAMMQESGDAETWMVLRRLFGIAPMMGVEDPEELRVWPVAELAAHMGVTDRTVENHVAGAKMHWKRWRVENQQADARSQKSENREGQLPDDEVTRLLSEQGFVEVESVEERRYIASRIQQLREWLDDDHLRGTARNMISQEVGLFFVLDPSIRELRKKISDVRANTRSVPEKESTQLMALIKTRREEQEALERTLKTLGMTEASGGGLKKKMGFGDFLSGMFDAVKAFKSQEDRSLIDGFFEAAEVEILTAPTTLRPIQYRPDLIVSLSEAVEHLWEADWSPTPLSRRACRTLTKAFGAALSAARAESGEVPRSDYPDEDPEPVSESTVPASVAAPVVEAMRPVVTALARAAVSVSRARNDDAPAMAEM